MSVTKNVNLKTNNSRSKVNVTQSIHLLMLNMSGLTRLQHYTTTTGVLSFVAQILSRIVLFSTQIHFCNIKFTNMFSIRAELIEVFQPTNSVYNAV